MKNTFKFTLASIKGLTCESGKKQTLYWDSIIRGFGLRVTKTGKQSFIFEQRLYGKTIRFPMREMSLENAQIFAKDLQLKFAQGIDPREEYKQKAILADEKREKQRIADAKNKILVSKAWDEYMEYQIARMPLIGIKKGKKWGPRHLQDHINFTQKGGDEKKRGKGKTVQGVLYPLIQMRLADINSVVLKQWLDKERLTRANNARQGFEKFRTFWNWCAKHREYKTIIDYEAITSQQLLDDVPQRNSLKDSDVLRKNNVKSWFKAVFALTNPISRTYLICLLLTGARKNELAALKWSDIDFKTKEVWLKDKMQDEGRYIPLNSYMEHLISLLPKRNIYVFSSLESVSGHISEPRSAHNKVIELAGIPHLTIQGLRRSFVSLFIWAFQPEGAAGRIMGHKPQSVRDRYYLHLPIPMIAIWHDGYVDWLLKEAGIPYPPNEDLSLSLAPVV